MSNPNCPIGRIAALLGRKWMLELIFYLRERRRFCELQQMVGGVNPATLSQRLKALEQAGLIRRQAISGGPLHVEYDLTEKGRGLTPALDALAAWARGWEQTAR